MGFAFSLNLPRVLVDSTSLMASSDTERTFNVADYTEVKRLLLVGDVFRIGSFTVSFDMKGQGGATVYGRVYINGVAAGTAVSTALTTYTTFTQSFSLTNLAEGTTVSFFGKSQAPPGPLGYVKNFRILATDVGFYGQVDANV